ncbi:hypothetical protein Tco_0691931 [Tanacetum coccineum]
MVIRKDSSIALTAHADADHAGLSRYTRSTIWSLKQQKSWSDVLVAPGKTISKIVEKSISRRALFSNPKEPTLKEVLDALKLTHSTMHSRSLLMFPEIYIQRDMLKIYPKLLGQTFEEPLLEEAILSFIRDLGHTGEIKFLFDVNVNHMHQPWRSFAAIINKCLSGKTTTMESLCLSRAQILWGHVSQQEG